MEVWLPTIVLLGFSFVLIRSTDLVVSGLRQLVTATHVGAFGIASFLLAFSTTLPEMLVGIMAAIEGNSALALGNTLGSNIANISLVLGSAALVSGSLKAHDHFLRKEIFYVFLAGSLPLLLLLNGSISRIEGVLLIGVYWLYQFTILKQSRREIVVGEVGREPVWKRILIRFSERRIRRNLRHVLVGVLLMIVSAQMMVKSALILAAALNIPPFIVGLFVIAIGTSLPELAFEIRAIKRRETQMAFGGILGSVVSNSTWVIGVAALISPITLTRGFQPYLIATLAFVIIFFAFWGLVWSKHRLDRWEGAVLVGLYFLFALAEWVRAALGFS
jgi:cation:H+ antiporter